MIYARIAPELLMDMQPYADRVHTATCMLRITKTMREEAELAELIAVDHVKVAHAVMMAEVEKIYPELVGRPYYFDSNTGEITLPDHKQENPNETASKT